MAVFDQNHGSLYVNTNGVISFDGDQIPFVNIPQSGNKHLIMPFFSKITTFQVGFVTYRHFLRTPENERLFCEADEIVGDVFSGQSNFSASFMLIATWYKVQSATPGPTRNTFQAVLVTDGTRSFAMFNYEDIQWSYAQQDQVGFDAGDGVNFYLISEARAADIVNIDERSNIGIRGRWLFRIDQSSVELPTMNTTACEIATTCHIPDGAQCEGDGNPQGCTCSGSPQQCSCSLGFFGLDCSKILFPFGLRDDIVDNGDFDSSGEIPVEFPFFGRYFNSIFVNIKGLLSFTNEITYFTPMRFPLANGIPSVAVYWADAVTADFYHGSIQYRYFFRNTTTRDAMLFRHADEIIRRVFTSQSEFSASWMMVATWHKVDFIRTTKYDNPGDIYNTFQGVLVTDGAQSFAIHNYQKIIWTTGQYNDGDNFGLGGTPAKVGFDGGDGINYYEVPGSQSDDIVNMDQRSNINTIGRWIFRIDLPEIQGPVVMSCPSAIVHNGNTFWTPLSVMAFNLTDSSTVSASCNIRHLRGGRDTIVTSDYLLPSYAARITCYAPSTSPVATCRFNVTFDNVAPVFQSCQSQVVYATPGTNQSIVVLDPDLFSAIDAVGGPVSVSCSFLNEDSVRVSVGLNSTFPLGMTTVDCEASDAAGNTAFCQLNVTVLESPPPTTEQMPTTGPKDSTTYDTTNGQILTSETTEIKTPVTAVTMSPATDDQTPATAATESLSTDDQTAASDTTVALSTDDQSPATAATVDPSTDDQTPTSDATECPSDDQTPATAAPMSPSTDDQTPATAAPMSPSTDDQTPATAAPMSPSTDDQTPATAAPMSPSTDDQTPATAAPMSLSTDNQTPATTTPMSQSTDAQTHDGTSEYPSGYQTTATDSPTPVCELTESSCQQGTFDEDHCECVCPVSISGRTCQVPNPCLDPTLCPGEEEYCVANIFNPVGYDCVCDALLGYLTEDGGSCTRYIARVFRLRVLGINGIAVDFLPAFGNPTSSASSEALGIIRGVLLFILKRNPLTSAVRDVTDISILSGGSIIVEFVALYNNTDTALVVPSVQTIQSVLQTQSRLEGESDYLAVDTQYVTTEQTTSTCPMNYCANGGTCDIVGLYPMFTLTCRCSTSFTGEHCDSVIPLMGVVPTAPRTDAPTEPPGEGVLPTILIIVIMIVVFVLALLILGFLCIMMRRRIILNRIPIAFKSPDRPSTGRGPDFSRRVWRAEDDANIAVFAPAWQRHLGTRFPARAVNGVRSVPQLQQIPPERSSHFMTPYMVPDFEEMPLHENQGRPMEHSEGQYWPNPAYSGQY